MSDRLARERINALLFYGFIFLLAYFIYLLFRPFLTPLAWAVVFAALFHPYYKRLEARVGTGTAATLATLAVTLIIVIPFVLVGVAFVQEAAQTVNSFTKNSGSSQGLARVQRAWAWLQGQRVGRNLGNFDEMLKQSLQWAAAFVANSAGAIFKNVLVILVDLVIMLFALFFFFRDGEAIMAKLRMALPFGRTFRERLITESDQLIRATITSGLTVALVQGFIGGLTFFFLGLGAPIFWGVIMGFFSLLPLGSWIIWGPAAVWLLLTGQVGHGIALLAVGAGGISLVDNVLRPILLSGRTEMSGLAVFISLLGGLATFGLLGLVLGPIIMATAISFVDAYVTERRERPEAAAT